jgi:hypothetical protein
VTPDGGLSRKLCVPQSETGNCSVARGHMIFHLLIFPERRQIVAEMLTWQLYKHTPLDCGLWARLSDSKDQYCLTGKDVCRSCV